MSASNGHSSLLNSELLQLNIVQQRQLLGMTVAMLVFTAALALGFARLDGDAAVYALLAKHMVQNNDWITLYFQGADWLDKPHFPFWAVAASFKLFGMSAIAYALPGLLFYVLGAWLCYLLALHLFDRSVAALSCVLYSATLGMLLGAADQKAEVYLATLMLGASYAWLRFADAASWRWWLLGSVCTASALMTKGLFVVFLLGAGLVAKWAAQRDWRALFQPKWLLATLGVAMFTAPELLALYLQFDAQPEKIVFERQGVSGLRFFFWDSQFGRFFNIGPIKNADGTLWFYFHNMLWTFLPWLVLLICTLLYTLRHAPYLWGARKGDVQGALAFAWAMFLASFLLFSATSYKMDYYLSIVFPYLLIICAWWWLHAAQTQTQKQTPRKVPALARWQQAQELLSMLVLAISLALFVVYFSQQRWLWGAAAAAALVLLYWAMRRASVWLRTLAWPLMAVSALFAFSHLLSHDIYQRYEIGKQIALWMADKPNHPVFVYGRALKNLDFFGASPALPVYSAAPIAASLASSAGARGVYLVLAQDKAQQQISAISQELAQRNTDASRQIRLQSQELQRFEETILPPQFVLKIATPQAQFQRQSVSLFFLTIAN